MAEKRRLLHTPPAFQGAGRGRLQRPVREALSWVKSSLSPESLEGFSRVTFARHFCTKKPLKIKGAGYVHNSYRPCEKSGVRPFTMCVSRALMDFCCRGLDRVPDVAWSSPSGVCHRISCKCGHHSSGHGRHQPCDAKDVERPSQIVDERRQACVVALPIPHPSAGIYRSDSLKQGTRARYTAVYPS